MLHGAVAVDHEWRFVDAMNGRRAQCLQQPDCLLNQEFPVPHRAR